MIVDPVGTADYPKPWVMAGSHSKFLAGGNVVLIDPLVLDFETQQAVANWLAVSATEPQTSVGCILIVRSPLSELVANRRIHESLARRFVGTETEIPTLAERGDDLRALVLDKVARLGMSLYGEPRAVDPAVLAELLNYDWPGNELELDTILLLLVQKAATPLITLDVLEQANFYRLLKRDLSGTPMPSMTTGRPPKRVLGQRPR
jgi:DNA-binding NtrC family response regulator